MKPPPLRDSLMLSGCPHAGHARAASALCPSCQYAAHSCTTLHVAASVLFDRLHTNLSCYSMLALHSSQMSRLPTSAGRQAS